MNEKSDSDAAENDAGLERLAADAETLGKAVKTVELGRRGFIAVVVFALVVGLVLPWAGGHAGWEALFGERAIRSCSPRRPPASGCWPPRSRWRPAGGG